MSNLTVDGRVLTEGERIKLAADMETEEVPLEVYGRIVQLGQRMKAISQQIRELEAEYGNAKGEFDQLTAQVGQ